MTIDANKKLNPALVDQSKGGASDSKFFRTASQQHGNPRQSKSKCPSLALQAERGWDSYRIGKLPGDSPRRRPTLARLRFLDDGGKS